MRKIKESFPKGIAIGQAFCNRLQERARLTDNIQRTEHTLLMSPRRYGKTSLVKYVLQEQDIIHGEADLFVAIDAQRIQVQILHAIHTIIAAINSPLEQKLKCLNDFFQSISARWIIGTQGVQISLIAQDNDPATNILQALQGLENLLAKKKQSAVLFIDEMQVIGDIASNEAIEGAIRHVAQQSEYLCFIFSGSNRRLLTRMFFDKSRPLYKLCDRIKLQRIEETAYITHLNDLAQSQWKQLLPTDTLDKIFTTTQCHSYYMNVLCQRLWLLQNVPTQNDVENAWLAYVHEERPEVVHELNQLSTGQRKILISIAQGMNTTLTGKNALEKLKMTSSSISEIIDVLLAKDYIEKFDEKRYRIVEPLLETTLQIYFD